MRSWFSIKKVVMVAVLLIFGVAAFIFLFAPPTGFVRPQESRALHQIITDFYSTHFDEECNVVKKEDYSITEVGLDEKSGVEFIISINHYCDRTVRGGSGNGEFLVIAKTPKDYEIVGEMNGQQVIVTDAHGNGYRSIFTISQLSASESIITDWEWNGTQYVEANTGYSLIVQPDATDGHQYIYRFYEPNTKIF